MSDKVRGTIAIVVGLLALYQSYTRYQAHLRDWHIWAELVGGVVIIALGIWRITLRGSPAA
jgi:putative Mn2+ efflux pump MntP